jgi:phosphonate transport system substrate-binding protein
MAEPLCFGISRLHGGPQLEQAVVAFNSVVAAALAREPTLLVADDYDALLTAVISGRCHYAWLPPLPLARAIQYGGVLAALSQRRGWLVYRSAFVVRADASFEDVASLRDARVAWTNASSAGGYIIPRATMPELGLDPGKLRSETFYGSVVAACAAVRAGEADVATCYVSHDAAADPLVAQHELSRALGVDAAAELRVIGVTPLIPPDGFVIAGSAEPTLRAQLRSTLVEVHRLPGGAEALMRLNQAERLAHGTHEALRLLARLPTIAP